MARISRTRNVPDRSKIDLDQARVARSWSKHLGVSAEELRLAVKKVGDSAAAVRKELARSDT